MNAWDMAGLSVGVVGCLGIVAVLALAVRWDMPRVRRVLSGRDRERQIEEFIAAHCAMTPAADGGRMPDGGAWRGSWQGSTGTEPDVAGPWESPGGGSRSEESTDGGPALEDPGIDDATVLHDAVDATVPRDVTVVRATRAGSGCAESAWKEVRS